MILMMNVFMWWKLFNKICDGIWEEEGDSKSHGTNNIDNTNNNNPSNDSNNNNDNINNGNYNDNFSLMIMIRFMLIPSMMKMGMKILVQLIIATISISWL